LTVGIENRSIPIVKFEEVIDENIGGKIL
jgi:hypothetical protein